MIGPNRRAEIQTTEQVYGQTAGSVASELQHGRTTQPEDSNSDYGDAASLDDLRLYFNGASSRIPAIVTEDAKPNILNVDYNVISNLEYFRSGASVVDALGTNDQLGLDLADAAWDTTLKTLGAGAIASPNFLLGVSIEWSIPKQYAQAFKMQIKTVGFKSFTGVSVDRNVTIKLGAEAGHDVGDIMYLLFAYRSTSASTPGYQYLGEGGMQSAILCPAYLPPLAKSGVPDVDWINSVTSNPDVQVIVPAAVRTNLSVTTRPITAASPSLAAVRQLLAS